METSHPGPLPTPTPETAQYWAGTKQGELRLQRCGPEGHVYFPPRDFCHRCWSHDIETIEASGRATLVSFVISHRPAPGFEPPFSIAIVELEEGPTMITNIVRVDQTPQALAIGMNLQVTYRPLTEDIVLPQFEPAQAT